MFLLMYYFVAFADALLLAVMQGGDADTVSFLLDVGFTTGGADVEGNSVWHWASVGRGGTGVLDVLKTHGVEVGVNRRGMSPLHMAAAAGNQQCLGYFIDGMHASTHVKQHGQSGAISKDGSPASESVTVGAVMMTDVAALPLTSCIVPPRCNFAGEARP